MFFHLRASVRLARYLLLCLVTSVTPLTAQADDLLAWRYTNRISELVAHLNLWLDENSNLPRNNSAPDARWIDRRSVASLTESHHAAYGGNPRGVYDLGNETIWLVRPWDPSDPRHVSVLLHELIHHRQAVAGHWYCPGAQELPAYRTQQAWLAELGLELDVN